MPLMPYEANTCLEGEDGSVHFAMREPSLDMIVPCWISSDALQKLCGSDDEVIPEEAYEACKAAVHDAASVVYDRQNQPSKVLINLSDV